MNVPPLISKVLLCLIPVAATIGGAVYAALNPVSPRIKSYVQHFAGGVVFSALAVEVLPDVKHRKAPLAAFGFITGTALMLALRWAAEKFSNSEASKGKTYLDLVTVVGLDVLTDGLLIGIASQLRSRRTTADGRLNHRIVVSWSLYCCGNDSGEGEPHHRNGQRHCVVAPVGRNGWSNIAFERFREITEGVPAFGVTALLYL
jgi:hypothetical protein